MTFLLLAQDGLRVSLDGAGIMEAFLISLVAGVVVWLGVPRGVVLVKSTRDPEDQERRPDTWTVTNDSSLPIRVRSAHFVSPDGKSEVGRYWTFVDDTLAVRQDEKDDGGSWKGVVIPPGEELRAHVPVNHTMVIRYRRDGMTGWFERRQLEIHGYV